MILLVPIFQMRYSFRNIPTSPMLNGGSTKKSDGTIGKRISDVIAPDEKIVG